jgi:hypothetical protein
MKNPDSSAAHHPPLRWTAILFAFAANLLLVTLATTFIGQVTPDPTYVLIGTLLVPLVTGFLTAHYAKVRGAMHAFIGGLLSAPILALFIFNGVWQPALFAFAFCTIGGAITEIFMRRRR